VPSNFINRGQPWSQNDQARTLVTAKKRKKGTAARLEEKKSLTVRRPEWTVEHSRDSKKEEHGKCKWDAGRPQKGGK